MSKIDKLSPEAANIQQLAAILTLEEVKSELLTRTRRLASNYVHLLPRKWLEDRQEAFFELIASVHGLSRVLEGNPDLYTCFDGDLFQSADEQKGHTLANIFEAILGYAFANENQRWRMHAARVAKSFALVSAEGMRPDEVARGIERVIAYDVVQ